MIGAVQRALGREVSLLCASGGLAGRTAQAVAGELSRRSYHLEYGFSCMGYEIAGGLGVKLAQPDRDVVVMVGDGSYMMMNSELATSVMMGVKLTIVLLDNRGFGCINRLQHACGGERFNNLYDYNTAAGGLPQIDFVMHARSQGAIAVKATSLAELEAALVEAQGSAAHHGDRHRHRPDDLHRCRWTLVGCGGAGSLGAAPGQRGPQEI